MDDDQSLQREDPAATQPDGTEDERTRTKRSARRECVGLCPGYNRSSRASFTHTVGPNSWKTSETKRTTHRRQRWSDFEGTREKGAMAFVECLGVSQEDTMEGSPWRETLGRSLDHTMRRNQSAGHATVTVAGKRPLASMLFRAQRRDGAPSPTTEYFTTLWLDPFARARFSVSSKIHGHSNREVADNRLGTTP